MQQMQKEILEFLKSEHVLHLALLGGGEGGESVHACASFYAFDEEGLAFVFASDVATFHAGILLGGGEFAEKRGGFGAAGGEHFVERKTKAAVSIAHQTANVALIKGVQAKGEVALASEKEREIYFLRFPFARAFSPVVFCFKIKWLKWTSNKFGFARKIIWSDE